MSTRYALLSVSDKTDLVDFAKKLVEFGFTLLSTGGTMKALEEAGVAVTSVADYTGSPEVMSGRVKTLHPAVHGGILARRGQDEEELKQIDGRLIDLVIVNLYPFEETLQRPDRTDAMLIENIDIGGPSMLRSAAKNHHWVTVVTDPSDYPRVNEELAAQGQTSLKLRRELAAKAIAQTSAYDAAIAGWLSAEENHDFPEYLSFSLKRAYNLRYGENPHQKGAFYRDRQAPKGSLSCAESIGQGKKELSFNNLVDADAALAAVQEFSAPAAVVVKHASPCGIATAARLVDAYVDARQADAMSAFGGIVALNREVDLATAERIAETFIECVVAPGYSDAALERLRKKGALRLLATGAWPELRERRVTGKRIDGGFVLHEHDRSPTDEVTAGQIVTQRKPSERQLECLAFAWRAVKHVKSNAIVLAKSGETAGSFQTAGIGGGQTARVMAVEVAVKNAGDQSRGAVLASDAFFPFPDGLMAAARAGVSAVVQPGGSKKDADVIAAADEANISMIFTKVRHFRH